MKLQDVLLKAMAKTITWLDRLRSGDRRKGKVGFGRAPLASVEEALRLYC